MNKLDLGDSPTVWLFSASFLCTFPFYHSFLEKAKMKPLLCELVFICENEACLAIKISTHNTIISYSAHNNPGHRRLSLNPNDKTNKRMMMKNKSIQFAVAHLFRGRRLHSLDLTPPRPQRCVCHGVCCRYRCRGLRSGQGLPSPRHLFGVGLVFAKTPQIRRQQVCNNVGFVGSAR